MVGLNVKGTLVNLVYVVFGHARYTEAGRHGLIGQTVAQLVRMDRNLGIELVQTPRLNMAVVTVRKQR